MGALTPIGGTGPNDDKGVESSGDTKAGPNKTRIIRGIYPRLVQRVFSEAAGIIKNGQGPARVGFCFGRQRSETAGGSGSVAFFLHPRLLLTAASRKAERNKVENSKSSREDQGGR